MSRRLRQHLRTMSQRAGRQAATKTQSATYLPYTQNQAQARIHELFPIRGAKSDQKMLRVVSRFPKN